MGYPLAGLVILVISLFCTDYRKILPLSFSKESFKELGKFTSWMIFGTAASYLVNWGDNIVLKYFVSLSDIGIYNLGYQFFRIGLVFNVFIAHYYTPWLAQRLRNQQTIQNYLQVTRKKTLKYILLGFIIAEIMTGYVIRTLFSPSYEPTIGVIRILLLANVAMAIFAFYLPLFHVVKKYRLANIILITQLITNITLDIIFIRYWGIFGAALATTIGYLVYVIIIKIAFESKIKKTLHHIWSTASLDESEPDELAGR
jgi:O-antigen/teichoic acid export membrane protein